MTRDAQVLYELSRMTISLSRAFRGAEVIISDDEAVDHYGGAGDKIHRVSIVYRITSERLNRRFETSVVVDLNAATERENITQYFKDIYEALIGDVREVVALSGLRLKAGLEL